MLTFFALLKQLKIFPIAPLLKHILGDKLQSSTIDTIPETSRLRTITENMTKMTICLLTSDICPYHEVAQVPFLLDTLVFERFGKAWPATTRIKLIQATEQGLPRDYIHIDSFLFVVPELVVKRWLSSVFLSHLVLYGG